MLWLARKSRWSPATNIDQKEEKAIWTGRKCKGRTLVIYGKGVGRE